jgi:hypothetical protein
MTNDIKIEQTNGDGYFYFNITHYERVKAEREKRNLPVAQHFIKELWEKYNRN